MHGQTNQLAIVQLRDRAQTPNALSITVGFTSGIRYREELLAEGAVRYWTFDEVTGTTFDSLVSKFDTDPLNVVGTIVGGPNLGVPGLVPNAAGTAIAFSKLSTNNSVDLPNGKDINAILGPWPKITHSFAFRANTLPRAFGSTNAEAPRDLRAYRIAIYLYGIQDATARCGRYAPQDSRTINCGVRRMLRGGRVGSAMRLSIV